MPSDAELEAEAQRLRDHHADMERRRQALNRYVEKQKTLPTRKQKISQVGKTEGGIACPKCGGTSFKARRTTKGRVGIVATGLLAAAVTRQKQVTCVTCGTRYARG